MSLLKVPVSSDDHHLGNINATVTLVEYGDYECPHCRIAHGLVKRLLKEKGEDLHFVFRNFPLRGSHSYAFDAATAAEAAGKQGKFWEMHDLIFENQEKLNQDYLTSLAESLQIDIDRFKKDSKSEDVADKVEADFENGIRSGVNGTPTFFLNGYRLSNYNQTYESLRDAVMRKPAASL